LTAPLRFAANPLAEFLSDLIHFRSQNTNFQDEGVHLDGGELIADFNVQALECIDGSLDIGQVI
jgi:hypothetical protein